MKNTAWITLDKNRATFYAYLNCGETALVSHPELPRKRYFILSKNGNWYWRNTKKQSDQNALGYVLV